MIDRVEFYIYRAENGYQVVADVCDDGEMSRWNETTLAGAIDRAAVVVREAFAVREKKKRTKK